jgi:predicted site-specific integrase-resolvase
MAQVNPTTPGKGKLAPAPTGKLRPPAAATRIGVTPGTLAKWRSAGTGPAYYVVAGRIIYDERELDAYVESCRVQPSTAA